MQTSSSFVTPRGGTAARSAGTRGGLGTPIAPQASITPRRYRDLDRAPDQREPQALRRRPGSRAAPSRTAGSPRGRPAGQAAAPPRARSQRRFKAAQARSPSSRTFVTPRSMKRRKPIACLLSACRRKTRGTRAGPNSAAGRRGRRRSAYEAPRAAADGGTRLGGAESKRRRRPRLPAPPSRVALLAGEPERRAPGQGGRGVRPPRALGLREAVGDHQQRAGMVPHAAVAAPHLDVLGQRALVLEAAPPRDHAVAAAVERAGGHGERRVERGARRGPGLAPPPGVEARDARGGGRAEWARERDHLAHVGGKAARQLAGVDAAQAPANEAQLLLVPRAQRDEAPPEPGDGARVRPEVPPEPPAVDVVAAIAEEAAQRPGRAVVREPARQHEHRVAVAARG